MPKKASKMNCFDMELGCSDVAFDVGALAEASQLEVRATASLLRRLYPYRDGRSGAEHLTGQIVTAPSPKVHRSK